MKTLIVEKTLLSGGTSETLYAVAASKKNRFSVCYSLTFEAHLTIWSSNRAAIEDIQKKIEGRA